MANRYIIACAACDLLTEVSRTDALTCGSRCRVFVHRHPERLDCLRKLAKEMGITVFDILEAKAVKQLRPYLFEEMGRGKVELPAIRGQVIKAFWQAVAEQVEREIA